jgi:hypothetical protein
MLIRTLYAAGAVAAIGLMAGVAYDAGSRHTSTVGHTEGQPETQPGMDDLTQMDPAAIIQMMREASAPDEHHHFLKKFAGEFDCTLKFWMEPGTEPETSRGTPTAHGSSAAASSDRTSPARSLRCSRTPGSGPTLLRTCRAR